MSNDELKIEQNPDIKTQKALLGLYWSIAPLMILTIALAWWKYPEPFEFFYEFISQLGGLESEHDLPNLVSSRIMTVGFGIIGLIFLVIWIVSLDVHNLNLSYYLVILGIIGIIDLIWARSLRKLIKHKDENISKKLLSWEITDLIAVFIYFVGFLIIESNEMPLLNIVFFFIIFYFFRRLIDFGIERYLLDC